MSRFGYDDDGEGMPWGLWQANVTRALGGRRGQEALADMERALLALPEPKLIEGHLAAEGGVCAIGALVAHKKAEKEGVDIQGVIDAMSEPLACWCGHRRDTHAEGGKCSARRKGFGDQPDRDCYCERYEPESDDPWPTVEAAQREGGLTMTLAWHLAQMNDDRFEGMSPEERYQQMLAFVRRAQGKPEVSA